MPRKILKTTKKHFPRVKGHRTNKAKNTNKYVKILNRLEFLIIMLIRMYIDIRNNMKNDNKKNDIESGLIERINIIKNIEKKAGKILDENKIDNQKMREFTHNMSELLPQISNEISKMPEQIGGFYFRDLEDKGDKPITGADLTKLLDEIQQFFYNAKYTEEGGVFRDTDTLLSLLRGDVETFKFWLRYQVAPKYYMLYPPFLKFGAIGEAIKNKKYEDYPDYLLAYKSYTDSQNQYLIEQGIATPATVRSTFFDNFANISDKIMTTLARVRRYDPRKTIL